MSAVIYSTLLIYSLNFKMDLAFILSKLLFKITGPSESVATFKFGEWKILWFLKLRSTEPGSTMPVLFIALSRYLMLASCFLYLADGVRLSSSNIL